MDRDLLNILIGGEAGQGLVTVGQILAKSLVRSGYRIVVTQDYQSRIRGGHNTYIIRVNDKEIHAPRETIDLIVAFNKETIELHKDMLVLNGRIIADEKIQVQNEAIIKVPFDKLSEPRYLNIAALGITCSILDMDEAVVADAVDDFFGAKHSESAANNRKALNEAYKWGKSFCCPFQSLKTIPNSPKRAMVGGNEAIALGAVSSGLSFYSFYPMTPATSIANTLASVAGKLGLIVEQAEDEIAAINMAIGASFTGAVAMVGTSGGGFALMVEGVSLAAMTETPLLVIVAQRPGPATGLPTRTEQADIDFVLHSGHGEFPRAIFAPGSIEECFHLTRKAIELAEKSQSPIFLLTDQYLADTIRALEPFDIENLGQVNPTQDNGPIKYPYRRFEITSSGLSPRLLPGMSENLVVADSDEHYPDGHITEDLSVRKVMVEKRLRKIETICSEIKPPKYYGDANPELLLVTWGSCKGAVVESVQILQESGTKSAALCFSQVWPLAPEMFMRHIQSAKKVFCVEGNAFGQFARLIRRETGFEITNRILRYDGLPITPDYILKELGR